MTGRLSAETPNAEGLHRIALAELPRVPSVLRDEEEPHPLLIVDLDRSWGQLDEVLVAARATDRILLGTASGRLDPEQHDVRRVLQALDLTLVPSGSALAELPEVVATDDVVVLAQHLSRMVAAYPGASLLLAHLLRWSVDLSVEAGLDAESLAYSTLLGGPEFGAWLRGRGQRELPPVVAEPVLVERVDGDLTITLNRPERRNAYGRQLRDALVSALAVAECDPSVTKVRLAGAGVAFCAGGDLDEFGTTPDPVTAHLVRTRAGAALPLHRLADRTTVRLHGACVGAGIELPAYAGHVVATSDAWMRLPEVTMGLIPGAGGTVSIPRRIGRWRTLYMALADATVPAEQAWAWGLVDELE